jgi:NAD(P)-dependent dehydrogenase (short-subunit alcohol dehydrogenase family)
LAPGDVLSLGCAGGICDDIDRLVERIREERSPLAAYAQALQETSRTPADEEKARRILVAQMPLGVRWIEPEDVAPAVAFLASDAAHMVSGAT